MLLRAWKLWIIQNAQILSNKANSICKVINQAHEALTERRTAQPGQSSNVIAEFVSTNVKWHPPHSNFLKCNMDVAVVANSMSCTISSIICDSTSKFLDVSKFLVLLTVVTEALGFREALSWMKLWRTDMIQFETDVLQVV